jgi:hypothetical protein
MGSRDQDVASPHGLSILQNDVILQKRQNMSQTADALNEIEAAVGASARTPARTAFLVRGAHALTELARVLDDAAILSAIEADSNLTVLATALASASQLAQIRERDPFLAATLKGRERLERLLTAEGGTVGAGDAAALLGVSRQAVDYQRRAGKLLGLPIKNQYRYPVWQFRNGRVLPALSTVLAALAGVDPVAQLIFFLTDQGAGAPLDLLRDRRADEAVHAAERYLEHGAP